MSILENIKPEEVLKLKDLVKYDSEKYTALPLFHSDSLVLMLFAFDKGQGLDEHASNGDALVNVLEGELEITLNGKTYTVKEHESLVMPAQVPHAVHAKKKAKMFLNIVFPTK